MENKINIIIGREYATRVRKKSFLIMTFLMPILFIGIITVPILIAKFSSPKHLRVAVIDKTGKYAPTLKSNADFSFVAADKTIEQYRTMGADKSNVSAVIEIKDDLLQGDSLALNPSAIAIYSYKQLPNKLAETVNKALSEQLTDERIASHNIPHLKEIIQDSRVNLSVRTYKWGESGGTERTSGAVAGIIGLILTGISYMFIMLYGGMVLQGVLEEKKSRIMEVMVSSVRPFDMMMGKIIGIGLVGLTQIVMWVVLTGILFMVAQVGFLGGLYDPSTIANMQQAQLGGLMGGSMSPEDMEGFRDAMSIIAGINFAEIFTLFILYFIGGYLLYAALFAAIGSAVSSDEDTNQFMIPVTILMLFSFYAAFGSRDNPDGALALWCSMIPFTSSVVMMVRLPFDVPLWQEIVSVLLLFTTFVGVTWIAAKIYRVGVLMYGKKPTLKELWRWTKYS